MERKDAVISLNNRFHKFMSQLPFVEAIDDMNLSPDYNDYKRADYFVEDRKVVIEVKMLESDPEYKVHDELKKHKDREEYPLYYWDVEVQDILKYLPDGEEIKKRLFYRICRSIEQSFREADKQIRDSKVVFNCPDSIGVLVLLNEDISVLSPEVMSNRISQMLTKTDKDGTLHYKNVYSCWLIIENYFLKANTTSKMLPSIIIDGPKAEEQPVLAQVFNKLQRKWADYSGVPLFKADIEKIIDTQFARLSDYEEKDKNYLVRHEIWRRMYRGHRYLSTLSDDAVLNHGAKLAYYMKPHFLKDGKKIPYKQMAQFMEGWTHFLEEAKIRGLNLKNFIEKFNEFP